MVTQMVPVQKVPHPVTEAATELDAKKAVLALLAHSSGSANGAVTWETRTIIGADGQSDFEVIGVNGLTSDKGALANMSRLLMPLCAPANATPGADLEIAGELTKTLAVTVGRERGDSNDDIALEVMVDELGKYPLDCIKRALGSWRRNEKWRPTLAELIRDVEWRARPRLAASRAVNARLEAAYAQP